MPYPQSSDVAPAQPTLAAQYNNLRADALRLGQAPADTVDLAQFLKRHVQGITLTYLATNRLRINYDASLPPTIMINGFMLQAYDNIDLAAGLFSGVAATWYVFAVRSAGSSTFTLAVNTSPVESTDQRLIGKVAWDGANISSVTTLIPSFQQLPIADYDSGWFAVATGQSYYKAHGFSQIPRLVVLLFSNTGTASSEQVPVLIALNTASLPKSVYGYDANNVNIATGITAGQPTSIYSTRAESASGYYRVLAWK